jgi:heme exporter protein C
MNPSQRSLDRLVGAALAAVGGWLYVVSGLPPEQVLGESIRILPLHVGAPVVAYLAYGLTAVGALLYLWRRDSRWDRLAVASAELALVFMSVTLVTGSLWGKVAQGWWWTWDARLTLTLILWLLSAGYLLLRQYTTGERRATLSAVLALMGLPLAVLNHFAVTLFRTQHPTSILVRAGGPAADAAFLEATVLSTAAYLLVFAALLVARLRLEARREALWRARAALEDEA